MAEQPVCVVVGVGPGNGESLVRKFADEGYQVAALARSYDRLVTLIGDIEGATPYGCDITEAGQVDQVFSDIARDLGTVHTLIYNAGKGKWGGLMDVSEDDLADSWRVNTLGLFMASRSVLPGMVDANEGVIAVTGATASLRGKPGTTAFAQAKGAQRMLTQSMAREYGPQGVHVFTFIIDGVVDIASTREAMSDKPDHFFLKPDAIATSVYDVAQQPRSAWTFEFDLRPFAENW